MVIRFAIVAVVRHIWNVYAMRIRSGCWRTVCMSMYGSFVQSADPLGPYKLVETAANALRLSAGYMNCARARMRAIARWMTVRSHDHPKGPTSRPGLRALLVRDLFSTTCPALCMYVHARYM